MSKPWRTCVAQAVYWVSGILTRVKTWRRTYELLSTDPFTIGPAQWRRAPCRGSMRLLGLSMRLDPIHWDHWALCHSECSAGPCPVCAGTLCALPPEDDD